MVFTYHQYGKTNYNTAAGRDCGDRHCPTVVLFAAAPKPMKSSRQVKLSKAVVPTPRGRG